jgi:hypothetical protein
MIKYRAVIKSYDDNRFQGHYMESFNMYRDNEGRVWLLYANQSDEPVWVVIDESTLEEIEV